nr:immunoglobulin light chain junction region [Macaca mulatta]
CIQHKALPWTF